VVGHALAATAARKDVQFADVISRHARYPGSLSC
jgi:type IV secretory pathway TrbD component